MRPVEVHLHLHGVEHAHRWPRARAAATRRAVEGTDTDRERTVRRTAPVTVRLAHRAGKSRSLRPGSGSPAPHSTLRIRICTFTGLAPVDVFSWLQSGLPSTKTTAGPGFPEVGVVSDGET